MQESTEQKPNEAVSRFLKSKHGGEDTRERERHEQIEKRLDVAVQETSIALAESTSPEEKERLKRKLRDILRREFIHAVSRKRAADSSDDEENRVVETKGVVAEMTACWPPELVARLPSLPEESYRRGPVWALGAILERLRAAIQKEVDAAVRKDQRDIEARAKEITDRHMAKRRDAIAATKDRVTTLSKERDTALEKARQAVLDEYAPKICEAEKAYGDALRLQVDPDMKRELADLEELHGAAKDLSGDAPRALLAIVKELTQRNQSFDEAIQEAITAPLPEPEPPKPEEPAAPAAAEAQVAETPAS